MRLICRTPTGSNPGRLPTPLPDIFGICIYQAQSQIRLYVYILVIYNIRLMTNGFFIGFALAILLWFLAFLYLKAFVRRRTSPDYILELLQEEVRQLEADIDEKTEQDLQLLEEKINSLREIINETERRIAVYNRELEKHGNEKQTLSALGKKPLVDRLEAEPPIIVKTVKKLPPDTKPPTVTKPAQPITITKAHEKLDIKPRPVKERIAELQKADFSPELIAKRLGLPLGEVQLYYNLAEKSE